jgi:preprotein translocase subunit SecD
MRSCSAILIPLALTACVTRSPAPFTSRNALIFGEIEMPSYDIISAQPGFSDNGQPVVNVRLSPAGSVQLEAITRSFLGRDMPIRVGTEILSNPRVLEPISGGQFQISGAMTVEEAQKLAIRIMGR